MQKNANNMQWICRNMHQYAQICKKYARKMHKICKQHAQNMQKYTKICPKYAEKMQEICKKYAKNMHRICIEYA